MSTPVAEPLAHPLAPARVSALSRRARGMLRDHGAWPVVGLVGVLVVVSLLLRTRALDASLWIDDAQTVGIASHPLGDIFGLLRQDGAPPLYYLLLSLWMEVFGRGEAAGSALALVFATAAIPAGLWAGWSLFGRRAGLYCATFAALLPLLSTLAEQARMYSLEVLLSLLATAAFVHAFVDRRRRFVGVFAVLLTAMLYTHYWSAFFAVATAAGAGWLALRGDDRRGVLIDALLAFGAALVLFAPWLPTLAFQVGHTGAPWADVPTLKALTLVPAGVLGVGLLTPLVLAAGAGLARMARREHRAADAILTLFVAFVLTAVLAWAASQLSPNWAPRYFAVLFGPLLLLVAAGLSRVGALGLVTLAMFVPVWLAGAPTTMDYKSNARRVLTVVDGDVGRGDLVISTQPEQVPVLSYYLPPGLRYATTLGPVADPAVMDWRAGVQRLRRSSVTSTLQPLLDRLPVGGRVLLVEPVIGSLAGWQAPWTALVRRRSVRWRAALRRDPRFIVADHSSRSDGSVVYSAVQATVFLKLGDRR